MLWVAVGAAPFPLPSVDGKPLAVSEGQTRFVVPLRFDKMREFYRSQLGDPQVVTTVSREQNGRVLTLVSRRSNEGWKRAVIRETAMGTEVLVTPVIRLGAQEVSGNGKPAVELILGRSRDVDQAVEKIDDAHLEAIRK